MKQLIGIIICLWLLYHYYKYMVAMEDYKRRMKYPQASKQHKPTFLKHKK